MLPKEENCTGCGACANICPVNAIKMVYSDMRFLVPHISDACIHCNKCERVCPSLNYRDVNEKQPGFYAVCANDDIRKNSSSGGMFTLLANYIFERNGHVCGAMFDDKFQLSHQIIHSEDELYKLRGSKYLQSSIGLVYRDIKKLLDKGEYVLFTGTPCQVAGLYAFLVKDYDNLITADLLCHGTPSQKSFDNYLKEIANGRKVKAVHFRSKRIGWNFNAIIVEFTDGTEYVGRRLSTEKPDTYSNAFLGNYMMRKSCHNCQFCDYPRQGDFTIGDLWQSEKLDPKSNDKKGTSFVFVNNKRAEGIFSEIEKNAKYVNEIVVDDYTKIPNRVYRRIKEHPNRRRFLSMLKRKPFSVAYDYAKNGKYDVGMLGYMLTANIGSVLTYYAFYNVLSELGYEVLPIERPQNAPLPISQDAVNFVKKWLPAYAQPVQYDNLIQMRKLNDVCEKFVVGSDQIWLQSSSEGRGNYCLGQWIDRNKLKIAYATSFGGPGARGSQKFYAELKYYLNSFYKISCREMDGVNFANSQLVLDKKVQHCIDPVFLANKNIYLKLIKSVNVNRNHQYVGGYVIKPRQGVYTLIDKVAKSMSVENIEVLGEEKNKQQTEKYGFKHKNNFPIEEALETIYNSKYFITDSYHGVCFCIIFKKEFLTIPRDFHDRFTTLLGRLGLSNRIVKEDHSNFSDKMLEPIDWDSVYEKLRVEIGISKNWLLEALQGSGEEFRYTDVDVLMEFVRKQSEEIEKLKKEIELMKEN